MTEVKVADLIPLPAEVPVGRGSIKLHALSLQDIVRLMYTYEKSFLQIYAEGKSGTANYAPIVAAAPQMVVDIITMSAGAKGQEEDVKRIPGPAQVVCLAEIWRLSVPDPKKLKESLSALMGELKPLMQPLEPVEKVT